MGDAHGGDDNESDQHQAGGQRDGLAAVQHPVLQRIGDEGGNQGQQQKLFLLDECEHCGPFCRVRRNQWDELLTAGRR
ncbi:hypothetical protein D3C86_1681680 [compost metagenome]